jgi:hypothetical protein
MRLKFILSLIAVLVIGAVAVGCGGSSSDSSSTGASAAETGSTNPSDGTTSSANDGTSSSSGNNSAGGNAKNTSGQSKSGAPLKKAEFIQQGDLICGEVPNEYEKLRQELLKGPEKKKASTAKVNEVAAIPPIYTAIEKFEELTPPKGEEDKAEAMIDALEAAAKGLEKEPAAPLVGPGSPYNEFQKLVSAYGFRFCNQL